jgi:hypothetical protein
METTILLTELRHNFLQQQSRIKSPILQKIVAHYTPAVNEPMIVDLWYINWESHIEWVRSLNGTHLGLLCNHHVYAPVTETVLLHFHTRYKKTLQPPNYRNPYPILYVLPQDYGELPQDYRALPLASLNDCLKAYSYMRSVRLDASPIKTRSQDDGNSG